MSIITVKRSDLSSWKAIKPPGYYLFEITEVEKPYSNKDNNMIHKTHLGVIMDVNGKTDQRGIEVLLYLNDAGSFVILNLVAAAEGIPPEQIIGDDNEKDIELNNLVGKRVWADVTHHEYEGKLQNDLSDFLPEEHFHPVTSDQVGPDPSIEVPSKPLPDSGLDNEIPF